MAYETGVAADRSGLLDAIFAFAANHGFLAGPTAVIDTKDIEVSAGTTFIEYQVRSIFKNGVYYLFAVPLEPPLTSLYNSGFIYLNTATGWDGTWFTGIVANWTRGDRFDGPYVGHHFFCDGTTLVAAVELTTGAFNHLMFGEIQKVGDWTGGQFVSAASWSMYRLNQGYPIEFGVSGAYVSSNFGMLNTAWVSYVGSATSSGSRAKAGGHIRTPLHGPMAAFNGHYGLGGSILQDPAFLASSSEVAYASRMLLDASPNNFNGRSVMVPAQFWQSSGVSATNQAVAPHAPLGFLGNVAHINIRDLNPKDIVNNEWMVFPMCQKNGPGTYYYNSFDYGYAFKL